jgi:NTP pyrophosphatase (non-canonical NTP hydrolase)
MSWFEHRCNEAKRKVNTFNKVLCESERQNKKHGGEHGEQNHQPHKWLSILAEEVGEVAKAFIEEDYEHAIKELVEVAATAITAIESVQRNQERHGYGSKNTLPVPQIKE